MLTGSTHVIAQPAAQVRQFVLGQLDQNTAVPPRALPEAQPAWIESPHGPLRAATPSTRAPRGARWRLRTLLPAMTEPPGFDGDREPDRLLPRWRMCSSPASRGLPGSERGGARRRRIPCRRPPGWCSPSQSWRQAPSISEPAASLRNAARGSNGTPRPPFRLVQRGSSSSIAVSLACACAREPRLLHHSASGRMPGVVTLIATQATLAGGPLACWARRVT
jgi:hypothetical protein